MSVRQAPAPATNAALDVQQFREGIENMRYAAAVAEQSTAEMTAGAADDVDNAALFERLTETEKSAAEIGASPAEWKPIGWMNSAHYTTLLKNNALAGRLTQQIEAYKVVATPQ